MLRCAECDETTEDGRDWRAYLGREDEDEIADVVILCPECTKREFGEAGQPPSR